MSSKHPGAAVESEIDNDIDSQTEDLDLGESSDLQSMELKCTKRQKSTASSCGTLSLENMNSSASIAEGEMTPKGEQASLSNLENFDQFIDDFSTPQKVDKHEAQKL